MRRFWSIVWAATLLFVGLVAGVILTYLTVIVPRSAELERIRGSSPFMTGLDLKSLITNSNTSISWNLEETRNELPYGYGQQSPVIWGRVCTASATVPAAQQKAAVYLIKGALMGLVTSTPASSGIQTISGGSSTQDGESFTQSDTFTYTIRGRGGSVTMQAWGTGDKLRVFVVVQEQ